MNLLPATTGSKVPVALTRKLNRIEQDAMADRWEIQALSAVTVVGIAAAASVIESAQRSATGDPAADAAIAKIANSGLNGIANVVSRRSWR
jgi:hypothetical protein